MTCILYWGASGNSPAPTTPHINIKQHLFVFPLTKEFRLLGLRTVSQRTTLLHEGLAGTFSLTLPLPWLTSCPPRTELPLSSLPDSPASDELVHLGRIVRSSELSAHDHTRTPLSVGMYDARRPHLLARQLVRNGSTQQTVHDRSCSSLGLRFYEFL